MKADRFLIFFVLGSAILLSTDPAQGQFSQLGLKDLGFGASDRPKAGTSVALSMDGSTAFIGGPNNDNGSGSASLRTRKGDDWSGFQGGSLVGTGAVGKAQQGTAVAISADGNTAIIGGPNDNNGAGAVWVWTKAGTVWSQQGTKLVGSGASAGAQQGISVSLSADGNTAIVGGYLDTAGNSFAGAAWVWTRNGGVWTQQGPKLVGSGASAGAQQGISVSLSADGNTALIGGADPTSSSSDREGAAWVWTRSGGVWTQQGPKLVGSGASGNANQGHSVCLSADGNTAIVGGDGDNKNVFHIGAGAAWVWTRNGGVWTQLGTKLVGTGAHPENALQGYSVSLSGDGKTAIVGGPLDRTSDSSNVGSVWYFGLPAPVNPQILTVTKAGTGAGTVSSSPSGLYCRAACSANFELGAVVTLVASPDAGSDFTGWSGDCTGLGGCQLTMSQPRNVTATFSAAPLSQDALLLSQDRVSVTLTWRSQYSGTTGKGTAVKQLDQYGYFWFESAQNPEVFVKVLDFGGDSFLVFHSALSDLEYTVSFKVLRTGQSFSFNRAPGSVCGLADGTTVKK